jgi:hypothetical protein
MLSAKRARMRRRRKWVLAQFAAAGRLSRSTLAVEWNTYHPDATVSPTTIQEDIKALRESEYECPFCHTRLRAGGKKLLP